MTKKQYDKVIEQLTKHRTGVSDEKRVDYTKSSEDVLANFKNVAKSTGVTPLQVWLVYSQKHFDAIANYVKTDGESESEPIKERFADLLNYLELGWALIDEKNTFTYNAYNIDYTSDNVFREDKNSFINTESFEDVWGFESVPEFCKSKGQCVFHAEEYECSCDRTNKFVEE